MKNKPILILLIALTLFAFPIQSPMAQTGRMEPTVTQTQNGDGTMTRSVFEGSRLIEKMIVDMAGKPLEVQEYEEGNLILTTKTIYGDNGQPVKTETWDEDSYLIAESGHDENGTMRLKRKYRIDGKVKMETEFNEAGKAVVTHHYKYDRKDFKQREWKTTEHREDGSYSEITYTEYGDLWEVTDYDPNHLRTKSTWFNWDGTRTETSYDEKGRPLRSERRDDQGAPVGATHHDFESEERFI